MYLVTGGAGFIGSNVVEALSKRGPVIVCDNLGDGDKWQNLAKRQPIDIVHPEDLLDCLEHYEGEIEAVIHMGAISYTTETDLEALLNNNTRLTALIWQHCVRSETRLIYASSASTYGDGSQGFKEGLTLEALAKFRPLNGYGWSKHQFDCRWAMSIERGETQPPQCVGLKFFNVYGPNEYHKEGQFSPIMHFYPQILETGKVKLFQSHHPDYKDGEQQRDFIYVKDVVKVIEWFLDHPDSSGLYNVGTGQARTFNDLAKAIFAAMKLPENIEYIPTPEKLRQHYQYYTQADMTGLRVAGYEEPFTTLEDGVKDYIENYLSQADPYL